MIPEVLHIESLIPLISALPQTLPFYDCRVPAMRYFEALEFSDGDFLRWGFDIAEAEPLNSPSLPAQEQKCQNRHTRGHPEPVSLKSSELKDYTPKRSTQKVRRRRVAKTKG